MNVLTLYIGEILGPSNFDKKVALIALSCFQGGGGGVGTLLPLCSPLDETLSMHAHG